jgi:hypothetical protein
VLVIIDEPTESRYHLPSCRDVAERHFETKKRHGWETGAYFWAADASAAKPYATPCAHCEPG